MGVLEPVGCTVCELLGVIGNCASRLHITIGHVCSKCLKTWRKLKAEIFQGSMDEDTCSQDSSRLSEDKRYHPPPASERFLAKFLPVPIIRPMRSNAQIDSYEQKSA